MITKVVEERGEARVQIGSRPGESYVQVRWPFDLETDEWIEFSVLLKADVRADAERQHAGELDVASGEHAIRVRETSPEGVLVEFRGRNAAGPVVAALCISLDAVEKIRQHLVSQA